MQRFKALRYANVAGLVVVFLVILVCFSIRLPHFHTLRNLESLSIQSVVTILVALGLTYVIVLGGIDLSVGSVAAFSCVIIALCLQKGWSPVVAALAGVAAGMVAGLINGVLITKLRVVPFIVTLGSLSVFRGAAKGFSKEQNIYPPNSWLNDILGSLAPSESWRIFPIGVWVVVIFAAISGWALRFTRFGRHVVAIGSNENAARLCGVPIDRVKIGVYLLSGAFTGLAGLMYFSRLTVGDPTVATGLELDGIAAVVIGGASLSGGQGSIFGTIIGALIMTSLKMGFTQMDLPNWVQECVTGAIIIFAVALDKFRRGATV